MAQQLFHLSCLGHFRKIFHEDKFLKTVESNIGAPEEYLPDPKDPAYNEPMVAVWPQVRRTSRTLPMVVPGEILKQMETGGLIYPRVQRSELAGEPDTLTNVTMVVGHEPLPANTPPLLVGEHIGPDVVWLTCDPTATQEWAHPEKVPHVAGRKDEILFVVDVDDEDPHLHRWNQWAFEQGINQFWYDVLNNEDDDASNWYVMDREIPMAEWNAVYLAKSGEVVWLNPEKYDLPDGAFDTDGLIHKDHRVALQTRYPKPEAYFAAHLREVTF